MFKPYNVSSEINFQNELLIVPITSKINNIRSLVGFVLKKAKSGTQKDVSY